MIAVLTLRLLRKLNKVKADDWVGLLANDEGYEILEALVNGRFHIEGDV